MIRELRSDKCLCNCMQSIHAHRRKKNKYIYIIIIIVALTIINPFNFLGSARSVFSVVFSPLSSVGHGISLYVRDSLGMVVDMGSLYEKNQELEQEIARLRAENATLADIKKENDLLRSDLALLPKDKHELIGAEVVLRDSLGGDQWIMIDKGSHHDVERDMAVIVGDSIFVGYIDDVDIATARVRLLTHPDSVVNVVSVEGGAEAISHGHHGLSVIVEDIKKDDQVKNGDMFVTSQIGNKLPRGLSVGTAQNISSSPDQLFQSAHIAPLTSLGDIRFVFVVKK